MPVPATVLEHYRTLRRLAIDTAAAVLARWRNVQQRDITGSWLHEIPHAASVMALAQKIAASKADAYLTEVVPDAPALALVQPATFAGTSADGRTLPGLLYVPVVTTLRAIALGAPPQQALATGGLKLETIVRSEVADIGRIADQVGIAARPTITGYARSVGANACSRCIILAGRWYRYSTGFQRHPNCDCVMVPATKQEARDFFRDAQEVYAGMSAAGRTKAGWSQADQYAIDNGADIFQVTNIRRSTSVAGLRPTRSRDPGRLTPDEIFKQAHGDREQVLALLRRHGYLFGHP